MKGECGNVYDGIPVDEVSARKRRLEFGLPMYAGVGGSYTIVALESDGKSGGSGFGVSSLEGSLG